MSEINQINIDNLCCAISFDTKLVTYHMFTLFFHAELKSADDVLNFKFNLLKEVIKSGKVPSLKSYQYF